MKAACFLVLCLRSFVACSTSLLHSVWDIEERIVIHLQQAFDFFFFLKDGMLKQQSATERPDHCFPEYPSESGGASVHKR